MKSWSRRTLEDFKWPCGTLEFGSSLWRYDRPLATPFMIFILRLQFRPVLPNLGNDREFISKKYTFISTRAYTQNGQ